MDEASRYERARKQVQAVRAFYTHLAVYLIVNLGLFLINMLTSPTTLWFYWATVGWGIGLAIHAITVFGLAGMWGPDWEEREIRKRVERDR